MEFQTYHGKPISAKLFLHRISSVFSFTSAIETHEAISERDKDICISYYFKLETLDSIAIRHELTSARVLQIANKAARAASNRIIKANSLVNTVINQNGEITRLTAQLKALQGKWEDLKQIIQVSTELDAQPVYLIKLEYIDLSMRAYNCLKAAKCNTVGDIMKMTEKQFLKWRNTGPKTIREVSETLMSNYGLVWPVKE